MIRELSESDIPDIRQFIRECPPLELHTFYTYWVLIHHFQDLCLMDEVAGNINGIITGLKSTAESDMVFLWQLGVRPGSRGKGISRKLLQEFTSRSKRLGARRIQVTIEPGNRASLAAFSTFSDTIGSRLEKTETVIGEPQTDGLHAPEGRHSREDVYQFDIRF